MATYAIGDVHGCLETLERLLEAIEFDRRADRLWFVGDLVNGGPDSLGVLRRVREMGDRATTVLGNHDLHMLAVAAGAHELREDDTFTDVLDAPDGDELLEWFRHRKMLHRSGPDLDDETLMVHAGLMPRWSASRAEGLARELEAALRGDDHPDLLDEMYGNEPRAWSDQLDGIERMRLLVNAFSRMRCLDRRGRLDFSYKETLEGVPDGLVPWFDHPERRSTDVRIVFGHWSAIGYHRRAGVHALDSGCVWGGELSALRLEDEELFQVDSELPAVFG